MAAPALPVTTASHVPLGHDAATGEPVEYIAAIPGHRVCNGLVTGQASIGKTTLARRIADQLRHDGWDVQYVDAEDGDAVDQATMALFEAERRQTRREPADPYHLVIWDGLHHFLRNPDLADVDFVDRLIVSLEDGPMWGVAHLATTYSLSAIAYGSPHVRNLFADNVIALRSASDTSTTLGPARFKPSALPREHGHALVLAGGRDLTAAHVHLDGAVIDGCDFCWRTENERLGQSEQPPSIALADAVFAEHSPTGRVARWSRGAWRFLTANPGDETPTPREVEQLVPVDGVLRVSFQ